MWSRADLLLATEPTTKVIEDVTDGDSVVRPRSPSRVERPKRQLAPLLKKSLTPGLSIFKESLVTQK
jgi:hypothetical protein